MNKVVNASVFRPVLAAPVDKRNDRVQCGQGMSQRGHDDGKFAAVVGGMEERLREQLPARQLVVTPVERDVDILLKLVVVDPVEVFTAFVGHLREGQGDFLQAE